MCFIPSATPSVQVQLGHLGTQVMILSWGGQCRKVLAELRPDGH